MARHGIVSGKVPTPIGAYSHVVQIGRIVAVAGQAGIDPATGKVIGDDIEAQVDQTFRNIASALAEVGAGMSDVIQVRVFMADLADFQAMNRVYERHFEAPHPARTTIGAQLPKSLMIEADVLAVLEDA